ncbi:MAG: hypothetical protein V3U87_07965 [Methylococcaceae bacterium]
MAKDTQGFVNINYIVNLVLLDLDSYTTSLRKKVTQYAILGYQNLNLYLMPQIKVAYLKQNENFTVDLPNDYIYYTKIGIEVCGRVVTFSLNENISHERADCLKECCCDPEPSCDSGQSVETISVLGSDYFVPGDGYFFAEHYRNGQYVGEMYGMGGGVSVAEFRIDEANRQIAISRFFPNKEVILEYKSSGVSEDGSTVVPREVVEALRAYIHWQLGWYNDRIPAVHKEQKQKQYYIEYNKLHKLKASFTMDEYLDNKYSVSVSSPSR